MRQIAINAGQPGEVVVEACKNKPFGHGFNAATNKYEDLRVSGVLDPAKVTLNAIENAASIAGLVLTTEVLVTDTPERKPSRSAGVNGMRGGGMGGMDDDEDDGGYM
jgi:chaperonin GroEL